MLISFRLLAAFTFMSALHFSTMAQASTSMEHPSVARRTIVCDVWQWIGHGATTWGCLYTPREAFVAEGVTTDDVVASLQKQINDLNERLKKLEKQ